MAGHSKWANIKHRKERADAKKGKVFSRIAKEIISAVKLGGDDPKSNTRLRLALQKAKIANVPNEIVDRNIKKAASADQADYVEMTYEIYGHQGVGLMIEVMTDNKNRIASDMRIATNKKGGTIASPGSVAFNFEKRGVLYIDKSVIEEDALFLLATDCGAEDIDQTEENFIVLTDPQDLYQVKEALDPSVTVKEAALEMIPKVYVDCDEEGIEHNIALIEWLEALEDVDAVFHNMKLVK